jgi:hypothetical protein
MKLPMLENFYNGTIKMQTRMTGDETGKWRMCSLEAKNKYNVNPTFYKEAKSLTLLERNIPSKSDHSIG